MCNLRDWILLGDLKKRGCKADGMGMQVWGAPPQIAQADGGNGLVSHGVVLALHVVRRKTQMRLLG